MNQDHSGSGALNGDPCPGQRLQALGTLTAALAHEMNNLLTPILGYTRLALQQPADEDLQRKAITRSHDAASRAVRACAAVMNLTRGPAPESADDGQSRAADVAHAVRAAADLLGWTGPETDTRLDLTVHPAGLTAEIAPAVLEQVLINLMKNARRAMGPGGAVTVHARRHPDDNALELTLRDNGPGVPLSQAASLFKPFATRPNAATEDQNATEPGNGLGLWISRALLEAAGGSIELDPPATEHPGACFRLRLPPGLDTRLTERRAA